MLDPDELSRTWNEAGRAYFSEYSRRLAALYTEVEPSGDLSLADPRSAELGEAVLQQVVALHARGEWARARERFDPAYAPLLPQIRQNRQQLGFVTILGPDALLVRRGNPWDREGTTFHLSGGTATPIADLRGVARSRNRDHLVLARSSGLELRDARAGLAGLSGPPVATIPWPDGAILRPNGLPPEVDWEADEGPLKIEQLAVSDDGMRVVVSAYRQGILLASRHPGTPPWTLLWPDARPPWQEGPIDPGDAPRAGDMTHVALSRDGRRLAFGSQDAGHFLAEIGPRGEVSWYATVGHPSEYPHQACFSDDGRFVALNSCHFYQGATVCFDWEGHRGVNLARYQVHDAAPCIDDGLRVYAACWLDPALVGAIAGRESPGGFALAGNGVLRICEPSGTLIAAQGFGSSASSIDFCPESRRLAVAGYSGFVHLYDPFEEEREGRIDGFRARRELARWVLWEHLPGGPVRW